MKDQVYFHKGLEFSARSCLQAPGSLRVAENIDFTVEGTQATRPPFAAVNAVALANAVHSVRRFEGFALAGHGAILARCDPAIGTFTALYSSFTSGARWRWREFKEFLHGVNGAEEVLFDALGNLYPALIANPTTAPTLADSGDAGTPDGDYIGYVSYLITWPNGMKYETGLSPGSANVTVATNNVDWTDIPICPYAAYYGTAPTIHRKLYIGPGTAGTLADIYYVATITNNTATTYEYTSTDAVVQANGASTVDDYGPGLHSNFLEYHYGRLTLVDASNPWRLYYSEAAAGDTATENELIMPIAFLQDNWDDLRVSGFEKTDVMGLQTWGTNFYIAFKQTWLKRQGNNPNTWSYKKSWAKHGVAASDTISVWSRGILYLSTNVAQECGIANFNGQSSELVTSPRFDYIFNEDLDPDTADDAVGMVIGNYYHLLYQDNAAAWKWLALDLKRFPDIRVAHWETVCGTGTARSLDAYSQGYDSTKNLSFLVGGSNGIVYRDSYTAAAIPFEVWTKDCIGDPKIANDEKTLKEIRFNLDTGGQDVTLELYIDGTKATWADGSTTSRTISGTGDSVQVLRDMPPNFKGRMFSLRVYDTVGHTTMKIYSPWTLIYDGKE